MDTDKHKITTMRASALRADFDNYLKDFEHEKPNDMGLWYLFSELPTSGKIVRITNAIVDFYILGSVTEAAYDYYLVATEHALDEQGLNRLVRVFSEDIRKDSFAVVYPLQPSLNFYAIIHCSRQPKKRGFVTTGGKAYGFEFFIKYKKLISQITCHDIPANMNVFTREGLVSPEDTEHTFLFDSNIGRDVVKQYAYRGITSYQESESSFLEFNSKGDFELNIKPLLAKILMFESALTQYIKDSSSQNFCGLPLLIQFVLIDSELGDNFGRRLLHGTLKDLRSRDSEQIGKNVRNILYDLCLVWSLFTTERDIGIMTNDRGVLLYAEYIRKGLIDISYFNKHFERYALKKTFSLIVLHERVMNKFSIVNDWPVRIDLMALHLFCLTDAEIQKS